MTWTASLRRALPDSLCTNFLIALDSLSTLSATRRLPLATARARAMAMGWLVMAMAAAAAARDLAPARNWCACWGDAGLKMVGGQGLDNLNTVTVSLLAAANSPHRATATSAREAVGMIRRAKAAGGLPLLVPNFFYDYVGTNARETEDAIGLYTTVRPKPPDRAATEGNMSVWADGPPYVASLRSRRPDTIITLLFITITTTIWPSAPGTRRVRLAGATTL